MPKAILALRSYPLAMLMALVLFVCSFLIATSSIGGGGDDSGSGMGGTGRSGGFSGDSGFGGTGGPSPFLGSNDTAEDSAADSRGAVNGPSDSLIESFLQQQQETARIPEDMQPLIELQRNAPQRPDFLDDAPALDILDDSNTQNLPPHVRRLLEMADSSDSTIVEPTLEIQIQIPEATGTGNIERFRMEVAEPAASLPTASETETDPAAGTNTDNAGAPFVLEQLRAEEVAENDTGSEIDEQLHDDDASDSHRPLIPERIQRPELPPFQRMRPAVDRASIAPPRPRPMQI